MSGVDPLLDWLHAVKDEAPNLRLGQLIALLHTARREGLRISELADLCDDTLSTTSRNVRSLTSPDYEGSLGEAYGLLELQRGADDGRVRHVVLSEDGAALISRLAVTRRGAQTDDSSTVSH